MSSTRPFHKRVYSGLSRRSKILYSHFERQIYSPLLWRWVLHGKSHPINLSPKSAMIFAPHQDDETFGCGGLIALKRQQDLPVWVMFLTDGGFSHPNHPYITREQLIEIRQQEAKTALEILRIQPSHISFLKWHDASLKKLSSVEREQIIDFIAEVLQLNCPQEVYVPYRKDHHPDHQETFGLVRAAIIKSNLTIDLFQYPIWCRWKPWEFDFKSEEFSHLYSLNIKEAIEAKKKAIEVYKSQYLPLEPVQKTPLPSGFLQRFFSPYELFFKTVIR